MDTNIVAEVVKAAGGAAALARYFGIKTQAICQWSRIPAERVIPIERLLDGKITRHQMRPDLYPPEDSVSVSHKGSRKAAG